MLTYFYFSMRSLEEQHYEWLIRSLMSQILAESAVVPEGLLKIFQECQDGSRQPGVDNLVPIMQQVLRECNESYIILDAIDECGDPEDVLELISTLMNGRLPGLHILVTSRPTAFMGTQIFIDIIDIIPVEGELISSDIAIFVENSLRSRPQLRDLPSMVKTEIKKTLVNEANGMYVVLPDLTRLLHEAYVLTTGFFGSITS
jgi:NACHT domain